MVGQIVRKGDEVSDDQFRDSKWGAEGGEEAGIFCWGLYELYELYSV